MIFPFPSSPHCAPIRIVFAIENWNQRWAKNFPEASTRTHSGLPTNNMLAVPACKRFPVKRRLCSTGKTVRRPFLYEIQILGASSQRHDLGMRRRPLQRGENKRIVTSLFSQIAFSNANTSADYSHSSGDRSFPYLALQYRLGLLSERRAWPDLSDRADPCSAGRNLMLKRSSVQQ